MRKSRYKYQRYLNLLPIEQQMRFWQYYDLLEPLSRAERLAFFNREEIQREKYTPRTFEENQGWEPYWRMLDILFWAHDLDYKSSRGDPEDEKNFKRSEKASFVLEMKYGYPRCYRLIEGRYSFYYPRPLFTRDELIEVVAKLNREGRYYERDVYGEPIQLKVQDVVVYEPGWTVEQVIEAYKKVKV